MNQSRINRSGTEPISSTSPNKRTNSRRTAQQQQQQHPNPINALLQSDDDERMSNQEQLTSDQEDQEGVRQVFRSSSTLSGFNATRRNNLNQEPPSKLSKLSLPIKVNSGLENMSLSTSGQVRPAQRNAYSATVLEEENRKQRAASAAHRAGNQDAEEDEDEHLDANGDSTMQVVGRGAAAAAAAAASRASQGSNNRSFSSRKSNDVNPNSRSSRQIPLRPSLTIQGSNNIDVPTLKQRCDALVTHARFVTSSYAQVITDKKTFGGKGGRGINLEKLNSDWDIFHGEFSIRILRDLGRGERGRIEWIRFERSHKLN